ncbi:MAG: prepilin-type N-terminal cleavage/methylation domain-containing protein, partial [Clostridia bacterium]|nr:prepilin-type N-terminal cleavage/methylation domain-containing protein [Clostridia bacterium]
MKKNMKRAFTIVELVIVIAIIAILAAVLVPTFMNVVKSANVSADTQLVRNLNTALSTEVEKPKTMQEALDIAEKAGYNLDRINAKASGNDILYDNVNKVFCYLKDGDETYIPEAPASKPTNPYDIWQIVDTKPETQKYSIYAGEKWTATSVDDLTVGFDAGKHTNIKVEYERAGSETDSRNVVIRTYGDQAELTVNAPNDNVDFYGFAKEINVTEVKPDYLHIYGEVNALAVEKGRVEVEDTGIVFDVVQIGDTTANTGAGVTINNNTGGFIAEVTLKKHVEAKAAVLKEADSSLTDEQANAQATS